VPGRSGSEPPWGELPLVVDSSAWARAASPAVRGPWQWALLAGRLRISPLVRFEILLSARGGESFDTLAEQLSALQPAPLTGAIVRAAEAAMRALAHRSSGAQRLPIVDYLVAAAAQELGAAVIHYDRDFDTLAEIMEFESAWLAPAGALD
jgi:predicted nucleic acid-binding protein